MSESLSAYLAASPWREGLTAEQFARVERDVFARSFAAGTTVCVQGTPADYWLGVVAGILKAGTVDTDGRATTFAALPGGGWFGEGALLKGELRPYAVDAIRNSTVAFMPRDTFQLLLDESNNFSRWVIGHMNARLGYYIAMTQHLRQHRPATQVAYCLSELFNSELHPATSSKLEISQEEVGRLSGVTRQNANRALHELGERRLVTVGYGCIRILDLHGLRRFAQGL